MSSNIKHNMERYKGLSEMINSWESLSENLKFMIKGAPIILPDIFLVSKSGTGRSEFVKFLAEYLQEKDNLMDFYGDVSWFEFKLGYCKPDMPFTEMQRFLVEVNSAAGFRNEYKGIIFIDFDEWKNHFEERYFLDFLECLSDNSENWLIIASVTSGKEEKIKEMGVLMSCYLRLERIDIETPTVQELLIFAEKQLLSYRIVLGEEAKKVIFETIEFLCQNQHFDWYKSVQMLCSNIAYSCYSEGKCFKEQLDAEDVLMFGKQSDYVDKEKKKCSKIGF